MAHALAISHAIERISGCEPPPAERSSDPPWLPYEPASGRRRRRLLSESETVTGGVAATVPVDVWLPGSPPSPFGILNALLIAVGKLASGGKGTGTPRAKGPRRRLDRGARDERRGKATPPKRPGGEREDRASGGDTVSGLFAAGLILFFMAVVTVAKRLQSGRLDAYLLYMLIALVAVIAVATALA